MVEAKKMSSEYIACHGDLYSVPFGLHRTQSRTQEVREEQMLYQRYRIMQEEPLIRERLSLILLQLGRTLIRCAVHLQGPVYCGQYHRNRIGRDKVRHVTI